MNERHPSVLSELHWLRGLVAERDGHGGDIPVWLALEWIDDAIKRVAVEPGEAQKLLQTLMTNREQAHLACLRGVIALHPDDALHFGGTSRNELEQLRALRDGAAQPPTAEPSPVTCGRHGAEYRQRDKLPCPWCVIDELKANRGRASAPPSVDQDGERYRFLRQPGNAIVYAKKPDGWGVGVHSHVRYDTPEQLDAAIDKARASETKSAGTHPNCTPPCPACDPRREGPIS